MARQQATRRQGPAHRATEKGSDISDLCWQACKAALRTASHPGIREPWLHAVALGREAVSSSPDAPEPAFNLAVALAGLARATQEAPARDEAAMAFEAALQRAEHEPEAADEGAGQTRRRFLDEALRLFKGELAPLLDEPSAAYGFAYYAHAHGNTEAARTRLARLTAEPTLGARATHLLAGLPEPPAPRSVTGRNEPCPCGSGQKYKRCHGR